MKILVIGSTGTIGSEVVKALVAQHEIIGASFSRSVLKVDFAKPESIKALYAKVGRLDAIVSVAGQAAFRALRSLTDQDFNLGLTNKLMGQVNLVRYGIDVLHDGGSFTLTGGTLSRHPMPGGAAISMTNAAIEGFTRAAALELPRGLRINTVAPGWVRETLIANKMDPSIGVPASVMAKTYVEAIEGKMTGQVLDTKSA